METIRNICLCVYDITCESLQSDLRKSESDMSQSFSSKNGKSYIVRSFGTLKFSTLSKCSFNTCYI
jgi:hypothetical protein